MNNKLEKMDEFFSKRVDEYDQHMIKNVKGCKKAYKKLAYLLPKNTSKILDLGCGTGLELDEIYKVNPFVKVKGIDLSNAMLIKLKEKHPNKELSLVCGDYFQEEFGSDFDCVISFQTMHHFSKEKKRLLYKKVFECLNETGMYIECDYMVVKQKEEDLWFSENKRIREEMKIGMDEFYHYDTPCTIKTQIALFKEAGFNFVRKVYRVENTTIIICKKVR